MQFLQSIHVILNPLLGHQSVCYITQLGTIIIPSSKSLMKILNSTRPRPDLGNLLCFSPPPPRSSPGH
ncbi:hypothetical protein Y1Q_0003253 [Alligator mississippiensis]|uniref:Uncharacterized protein n=1 Tax=Alligator mississippiensis TaxID=8496 RepID=A0A151MEE1_ALLMI|nr:hypothetical protein Y1Q_0003253 [Alligator mississippiensis]